MLGGGSKLANVGAQIGEINTQHASKVLIHLRTCGGKEERKEESLRMRLEKGKLKTLFFFPLHFLGRRKISMKWEKSLSPVHFRETRAMRIGRVAGAKRTEESFAS